MKTTLKNLLFLCFIALAACRPVPTGDEVRSAVADHFAQRGYPVVDISVKSIRPLETREKTYMGVPTYTVVLDRLVLNVEGKQRTFTGVRLMLKKLRSQGTRYVVSDISGVTLQ